MKQQQRSTAHADHTQLWADRADYYYGCLCSGVYQDAWGVLRELTPAKEAEYREAMAYALRKAEGAA